MWERIKQILIKEFIQILRDPRSRAIVFVMPIVQVLLFGYAVTTDVKNVSTGVYDQDNSVYSRQMVARFVKSGYFQIDEWITREDQIQELMDQGRVQALLRINKGFDRDLTAGRKAPLQLILDGTDSNTAAIVLGYSSKIVAQYSQEILADRASRLSGGGPLFGQVNL
jgi:ABC-2 type transport system permease protein